MYSSIEVEERPEVIKKCYRPIMKLADEGIPIGLEVPAITLKIIATIDPQWIKTLSDYINDGTIEFIGSGYSQIIGPLVPAQVNAWNQKIGIDIYEELLSARPKLALVNEMAYSSGIVEHYLNSGYEGLIMEWNNPRYGHPEWENEWRYNQQKTVGNDGVTMPLIWADSIAFQKFQRYAHGEYELDEYVKYIRSHISEYERYFPLYSNDAEIFNYRSGRYHTETIIKGDSEWSRIIELYHHLNQEDWCELVFPSDILLGLKKPNSTHELQLESPAQPIPVKKQEKYNINRWALTGRDDMVINTQCYKIYDSLMKSSNENTDDWSELCYLWSSDFRTHITDKRWAEYQIRLNEFQNKLPIQTTYKTKGKSLIEDKQKIIEDGKWLIIENPKLRIILNKNKGLSIKELVFKNLCDVPLLGTLDLGYYDDISLGADYYSGHAVIESPCEHKVTDLGGISLDIIESDYDVALVTKQKWKQYSFSNKILINGEKIVLQKSIYSSADGTAIIHPYNFTFNPKAWDRDSLYIETHNGGTYPERFFMKGKKISHGDIYSSLISARHGFGCTEGLFIIGDKDKSISFKCDMSVSALILSIIYKEMDDIYFFRLQYSAQEMDETYIKNNNSNHTYKIIIWNKK